LRKSNVLSDKSTQLWLNHFTRIGFVSNHKKHIEHIETILEDSLKQFFYEKNKKNRDERKIQQLKNDIRENTKLLSELNLGTPIISAIKRKVEDNKNEKRIPNST
jgi:mevalonate kinase